MRAGSLALWLVCGLLALAGPSTLLAQARLEVVRMVLAEPRLVPGGEQLVQVSIRNTSATTVSAGLRAEIHGRDNKPTGLRRQRRVTLPPGAERRVFLRLDAPDRPGKYTVRLVVLTADFKRPLLAGLPKFAAAFVVSLSSAPPLAQATGVSSATASVSQVGDGRFNVPGGLQFERADLLWENFLVEPGQLMLGDTLRIKADLRNVGGDIARGIDVQASYFNTRLPGRFTSVATSKVDLLAPGEKLELEFEYKFPDDALLGDYQFVLVADAAQRVPESNEQNNREITARPIRVSTILQTFPEPGFAFDQAGLFLFRWKSVLYDEFKVQVGTEDSFENKESFFDIPQGGKWTGEREIVPLPGEMPGMLLGLMVKDETSQAYWRVVGRIAGTQRFGFSKALPFRIRVEEEAPTGAGGTTGAAPSGGVSPAPGTGSGNIQPR